VKCRKVKGVKKRRKGNGRSWSFNPCDFIESYESLEECAAPDQRELRETEPPPIVIPVSSAMFLRGGASHE
jgi:hypothetical protein